MLALLQGAECAVLTQTGADKKYRRAEGEMSKANIYFTRMKRCRGSKDTESVLSTPVRESIAPSGKRPPAPTDSPSSKVLFQSPTSCCRNCRDARTISLKRSAPEPAIDRSLSYAAVLTIPY